MKRSTTARKSNTSVKAQTFHTQYALCLPMYIIVTAESLVETSFHTKHSTLKGSIESKATINSYFSSSTQRITEHVPRPSVDGGMLS